MGALLLSGEKMLVAFLKTDKDVNISIEKFEDRIWINEKGDADVLRRFWVKVNEDSSIVSMIRCFISRKPVVDIEIMCEYGDSRTYAFNNRERYTGIVDIVKGREENTIDGIRYHLCKINTKNVELVEVGEGLSIDINFSENPLIPGFTYLVPIKYTIKNLIDLTLLKTIGETQFTLSYFMHPSLVDMYSCIEESMVIPVTPILPEEDGGFAVFVYVPPAFQIIPRSLDLVEVPINYNYRGEVSNGGTGIFVELCDAMNQRSINLLGQQIVFKNNRFNYNYEVHGKIVERVYPRELRNQISALMTRIGRPSKYTWIAIGLGALGVILALISIIT